MSVTKNILTLAGAILLCLIFSCKASRIKTVAETPEKSAFFTLAMKRDSVSGRTSAEVRSINIVNVVSRYTVDDDKSRLPDFLKIEIVYENNKTINVVTDHPLYKRFDLYEESGKIESKSISLSQGETIFRVPYFSRYKKITIVETVNSKQSKPIVLKNEK